MRGKFTCVAAVSAIFLAGCAGRRHEGRPAAALGSWPPQPPPPVANADPSRRHRVSIRVPTGFRVARRGDMLVFNFTSYEKTNLTVGYRMLLGITEEIDFSRNGKDAGTYTCGHGRNSLPARVPPPGSCGPTNEIPVECRVIIYESDQPFGYHVGPEEGKWYKVLWSRTFKGPFE